MQTVASLAQRKRVLNTIWLAMVMAVGSYWMIHALVMQRPRAGTTTMLLPALFIAESVLLYAGGWWWHARTIRLATEQVAPTMFMRLGPEGQLLLRHRLLNSAFVCLALFEAPAVIGLVNSLIGSPLPHLFEWLAGTSLVCLTLFRLQGYLAMFDVLDKLETGAASPERP